MVLPLERALTIHQSLITLHVFKKRAQEDSNSDPGIRNPMLYP